MSIEPIRKTVRIKAAPARAFDIFTSRIGEWWPRQHTIGATPHIDVTIEPFPDGRWYETGEDGRQTDWGRVLAWDPPHRLLLAWQIDASWSFNRRASSEVELTFAPDGAGTRVEFEHRHLERLGVDAARVSDMLRGGWPGLLEGFAAFSDDLPDSPEEHS